MGEKFRISDIFKKSQEKPKPTYGIKFYHPKPEKASESDEQPPDKINFPSLISKAVEKSNDTSQKIERKNIAEDSVLYSDAVSLARQVYKNHENASDIVARVYSLSERMAVLITSEDKELLKSAMADYLQPEDYIYYHVVNVCIFSIYLGQGLSYDRPRLIELGVAAFFHDIGLPGYIDIINQNRIVNPQEFTDVKRHPVVGPEILYKIDKTLQMCIFDTVRQEHERIDGKGYPKGLKNNAIVEYAQIVGLSDVYEAMIHTRPYRDKHSPMEAIKAILDDRGSFAHRLIKILIEKIGIFPIGTIVKLNTEEIGQVIELNPKLPLRPVVNIIHDSSGERLSLPRKMDLADSPTIYILGPSPQPK